MQFFKVIDQFMQLFMAALGLLLWNAGPRAYLVHAVGAHRLRCPRACGIFPDPGSNPWPCIGR